MPEMNLTGKIFFPAGSVPSLEEDMTIEVVANIAGETMDVLVNGESIIPGE